MKIWPISFDGSIRPILCSSEYSIRRNLPVVRLASKSLYNSEPFQQLLIMKTALPFLIKLTMLEKCQRTL